MKIGNIVLGVLLLSSTIIASVNIDTLPHESKSDDTLQDALDQYHLLIRQERESEEDGQPDFDFEQMLGDSKFHCTGGKDPSKLSNKNYLEEFAKGPCNPTVVLPGVGGSKLRVLIDCETFKSKYPEGFKACGWERCSGLKSPKSEYRIWLPGPFSPMSITLDDENARVCFNSVMGFDTSELSKGIVKPIPGTQVVIEGKKNTHFFTYFLISY